MELETKEVLIDKMKKCINEGECNNVGIFVDFDNFYYSLKGYAITYGKTDDYDIFRLMNEIYGKDHIRTMRAYADYDQVKVTLRKLQEQRVQIRNVYGNGQNEKNRKNASDIELSIDAIESYYSNKEIDTYVFITADSDMIPIMSRMIYKGMKVHLYYISDNASSHQDMTNYCHYYADLIKIMNIDSNRKKPEFHKDNAIKVIKEWYDKPGNKGKTLGTTWFNNELTEQLDMSYQLASDTINYLLEHGLIEEKTNGHKYYEVKKEQKNS